MKKLLFFLVVVLAAVGARAESTNITTTDIAQLDPTNATTNNSSLETWTCGQSGVVNNVFRGANNGNYTGPILISRFDLSTLPDNATITKATFNYTVVSSGNGVKIVRCNIGTNWSASDVTFTSFNSSNTASIISTDEIVVKTTALPFQLDVTSFISNKAVGVALYTDRGRTATISEISLDVEYTTETVYTATFTETSDAEPVVTIYTDEALTTCIEANSLSANTTYYYKATLAGYEDYTGSFTVEESNPTVSFTMKNQETFTFNIKASDGTVFYTDEEAYEGKEYSVCVPYYLTDDNNKVIYKKSNNTFKYNGTAAKESPTITIDYTEYIGDAWFVEAENVISSNMARHELENYSGGKAVRGISAAVDLITVPESGKYNITYANASYGIKNAITNYILNGDQQINKEYESVQYSYNYIKTTGTKTLEGQILLKGDVIKFNSSNSYGIIDYILLERTGDATETISVSQKLSTYTSTSGYALDFSNAENIIAYKVAYADDVITLTKIEGVVPAGEGVVLYAPSFAEGVVSEDISYTSSTETIEDNDLKGAITETTLEDADNLYNYALNANGNFQHATGTLSAGKAYLALDRAPSNAADAKEIRVVFADSNVTGVDVVEAEAKTVQNDVIYNLNGQVVTSPQRGIYIINGKKVIFE